MCNLKIFLLIWSIFNIIFGVFIFGIPALIFSRLFYSGNEKYRSRAIIFNILSSALGLVSTILIAIYFRRIQQWYISVYQL